MGRAASCDVVHYASTIEAAEGSDCEPDKQPKKFADFFDCADFSLHNLSAILQAL